MIYLDNGATSYPKPREMIMAMQNEEVSEESVESEE